MSKRSQSEAAGLRRLRLPISFYFSVVVVFCALAAVPSLRSQPHKQSAKSIERSASSVFSPELQSHLVALESAKKLGDPKEIAASSRSVLGLGLRDMGRLALARGDVSTAVDLYKRARDFEDSAGAQLDLANVFVRERRLDKSLSLVTDVLVADPQNAAAWYAQGKIWILKSKYDEAVKSLGRALELQSDPAAWYLMGAAFLQLKQREPARDAFAKLTGLQGDLRKALADAYASAGYLEDAVREMPSAGASRAYQAVSSEIVIRDAAMFQSQFENQNLTIPKSSRILKATAELRFILASALNDLGTAEARQERYELALAHFHEAANWNAEMPGLARNIGIAAGRATNYAECIRALRPVLAKDPKDNVARAMLGTALFSTEAYAEAAQVFTPLGNSALQVPELTYTWASSLVHANRFPEAVALLNQLEQQRLSAQTLMLIIPL